MSIILLGYVHTSLPLTSNPNCNPQTNLCQVHFLDPIIELQGGPEGALSTFRGGGLSCTCNLQCSQIEELCSESLPTLLCIVELWGNVHKVAQECMVGSPCSFCAVKCCGLMFATPHAMSTKGKPSSLKNPGLRSAGSIWAPGNLNPGSSTGREGLSDRGRGHVMACCLRDNAQFL